MGYQLNRIRAALIEAVATVIAVTAAVRDRSSDRHLVSYRVEGPPAGRRNDR